MRVFALLLVALATMTQAPLPSATASSAPLTCGSATDSASFIFGVETTASAIPADDLARMYRRSYASVLSRVNVCPVGTQRDVLRAYVFSYRAFLGHYDSQLDWRDDLNLSDQLFAACVKRNAGTTVGARCATAMETNARWRRDWDR